ncbi:uncharacterized protein LOC135372457 [Ornithodoros turicata]|uniref:uncharacterized protein LOC135372457 n=1 Tax=Ornithodoros turicata TaxID=34597 RepID=UPI003138A5C6
MPSAWKTATIIPILKPGKDSSTPSSYRPIALTSCIGKTFELIVNNRLVHYLEENNCLSEFQCWFRMGCSTTDHSFAPAGGTGFGWCLVSGANTDPSPQSQGVTYRAEEMKGEGRETMNGSCRGFGQTPAEGFSVTPGPSHMYGREVWETVWIVQL